MQEIERKFLVLNQDFMKEAYSYFTVKQGYINSDPTKTVRVRTVDDEYGYLTIKGESNESGTSRMEMEYKIPISDARELMKLCGDDVLNKTRHNVRVGNHVYEVDVFHDGLSWLIMAEIELDDENEEFEKPSWLGEEVTGNKDYYNMNLLTQKR